MRAQGSQSTVLTVSTWISSRSHRSAIGHDPMTTHVTESSIDQPEQTPALDPLPAETLLPQEAPPAMRLRTILAIPLATIVTLSIHFLVSKKQPPLEIKVY